MNIINNPILYNIWKDRYCKNNETLEENYRRVAHFVAQNAAEEEAFYKVISEGLFLPAGRTMSNAGIGETLTLNNCFVAPQIEDDLGAIFDTVKLGAVTHKNGGGIGYDFSKLRPGGSPTSNDAVASGPVSFMEVFDAQTSTILQGNRRGANMGVLSVRHPDIEEFITVKTKSGKLTHFNLSVMVDDEFMMAVENHEEFTLHFPVYDENGSIIKDASKWQTTKKINAEDLWNKIMQFAYDNGEPGIFFYENMNSVNNLWYAENIVTSNPCAEYLAGTVYDDKEIKYGGACNLGSLILPNFVNKPFTSEAAVNIDLLFNTIQTAVRMLDNIIDCNKFPDEIYKNYQTRFRTIGLGVTGLADMLVMLGMKYDSAEAIKFTDNLFEKIAQWAYDASIDLAKEKGAFPGFKEDFIESGYVQSNLNQKSIKNIKEHGIRNAKILAVAPTGTMSLTFGNNCSSGIEPIFSLEYDRKIKFGGQSEEDAKIVTVRDYAYEKWMQVKDNPDCIVTKDHFVTALNIDVKDHVNMLAAIAKHVDMSVSKTINVPKEYSFEETKDIYMKCWKDGIKGCTIFRPNEIRAGILMTGKETEQNPQKNTSNDLPRGYIVDASEELIGYKRKIVTGCGSIHMEAYADEMTGEPQETFINIGSSGGCERNYQFISRLISLALRSGTPVEAIIDQALSIRPCSAYTTRTKQKGDTSKGTSCPSAIGYALDELYDKMQERCSVDYYEAEAECECDCECAVEEDLSEKCPDCGEPIVVEGGCNVCKSCGWSKCS